MKSSQVVTLVVTLGVLSSSVVLAEHGDLNPVARLRAEAQELNTIVQSSYIRYYVKSAVYRFARATDFLNACMNGSPWGRRGERGDEPFSGRSDSNQSDESLEPMDHGDAQRCELELRRVQDTWFPVERYLYDTNYDLPQVYYQYLETSEALAAVMRERGSIR